MATQTVPRISETEYLERERKAEFKSEYVNGEIFAMAGGSLRHSVLAANWIAVLSSKRSEEKCRIFTSDARIRTFVTGAYVYPDVSVVCGETELYQGASDILTNPLVVIEVLSPSTADYNRGKKFELYREIPSLRDYVLTHADGAYIEYYSRQTDASWVLREYRGAESSIHLAALRWDISLAELYTGVFELPS